MLRNSLGRFIEEKIIINCFICKKSFKIKKSRLETAKYCSIKCRAESKVGIKRYDNSKLLKKLWKNPQWRKKQIRAMKGKRNLTEEQKNHYKIVNLGEKNPIWKDIISKEKLEDLYLNKKLSLIQIAKMKNCYHQSLMLRMKLWNIPIRSFKEQVKLGIQQNIKNRYYPKGSKNGMYGKISYPKLRFVPELNHSVRSLWEEIVARKLKQCDIKYSYETVKFKVNNGNNTYTPDFITGNILIEVKGPLFEYQRQKMLETRRKYPDFKLIVVTQDRNLKNYNFDFADKVFLIDKLDEMISWLNENR